MDDETICPSCGCNICTKCWKCTGIRGDIGGCECPEESEEE